MTSRLVCSGCTGGGGGGTGTWTNNQKGGMSVLRPHLQTPTTRLPLSQLAISWVPP